MLKVFVFQGGATYSKNKSVGSENWGGKKQQREMKLCNRKVGSAESSGGDLCVCGEAGMAVPCKGPGAGVQARSTFSVFSPLYFYCSREGSLSIQSLFPWLTPHQRTSEKQEAMVLSLHTGIFNRKILELRISLILPSFPVSNTGT